MALGLTQALLGATTAGGCGQQALYAGMHSSQHHKASSSRVWLSQASGLSGAATDLGWAHHHWAHPGAATQWLCCAGHRKGQCPNAERCLLACKAAARPGCSEVHGSPAVSAQHNSVH